MRGRLIWSVFLAHNNIISSYRIVLFSVTNSLNFFSFFSFFRKLTERNSTILCHMLGKWARFQNVHHNFGANVPRCISATFTITQNVTLSCTLVIGLFSTSVTPYEWPKRQRVVKAWWVKGQRSFCVSEIRKWKIQSRQLNRASLISRITMTRKPLLERIPPQGRQLPKLCSISTYINQHFRFSVFPSSAQFGLKTQHSDK